MGDKKLKVPFPKLKSLSPLMEEGFGVGVAVSYPTMRRHEFTARARQNRSLMTPAEQALWHMLRGEKLAVKFRRQQPVGPYILDFYCSAARLGVEADGNSHEGFEAYDEERDRRLAAEGIRILRFTNDEILLHPDSVQDRILEELANRPRFRY